jgi:hypothetical protein
MLLPFLLFDGSWIWIGIAQERDPEEGHTVTNLGCSPSWIQKQSLSSRSVVLITPW